MAKFGYVITFLMIFSNLHSQTDSIKRFHIYTSPLQAIDPLSRPMITIGGEYLAFNKIGLSGEYGYKIFDVDKYDSTIVDSKGYTYRIELKYYDIGLIQAIRLTDSLFNIVKRNTVRDYISIEYRYIKDDYNSQFEYATDSTYQTLVTENYAVLKDIYVANIKYGVIFYFGNTFYMDLYTGIGLRYRDVRNINRTFNEDLGHEHKYPEYFWVLSDFEEFSGFKFNFSLGFKVGVRF